MGTPLPLPAPRGTNLPIFGPYLLRPNGCSACIKMSLGVEVGLDPGGCVRWGPRSPLPKRGAEPPSQIFGPCLLRPNGWIDEAGTWHGGRPQPRRRYVRWGPSSLPPKGGGAPAPIFGPCLLRPNGWMDDAGTWHGGRPQPRRLCVRWRPSPLPPKGGGAPSTIFGPFLLWPNGSMHQNATWYRARHRPMRLCLMGPSSPSPKGAQTPNFRPISVAAKWLHGSRCHLVWS